MSYIYQAAFTEGIIVLVVASLQSLPKISFPAFSAHAQELISLIIINFIINELKIIAVEKT